MGRAQARHNVGNGDDDSNDDSQAPRDRREMLRGVFGEDRLSTAYQMAMEMVSRKGLFD